MKKVILLLCSIMLSAGIAFADGCFIAKENGKVLQSEGDPEKRYAPMSTFKITLSLIGFDSGILIDEMHPVWPFKEGYVDWREVWKQDQTPKSWMKESCVWYSQVLTKQLGMENFKKYVTKFDYGNKDLSGDKGQNNGLTNAWLSSSLQISSAEQVAFLQKMLAGKLPVKLHAVTMTKNILFVEELKNGWKFYGKTGMGSLLNADGTKNPDLYHGWFIGWIEKGDRRIIFSNHIEDDKKEEIGASQRAKLDAKEKMTKIIDRIEGNK
ncbi:class D beta-lactamase [Holospora undulata]|uniref:beta-lactamase n=1 Tax=Holospora undulata HU1 TaxID=1321371 RepID=A0A061JGV3_9PROT|nr:class D beta-lactamase [Holospora undulata]ETZ04418.1 beta-lactamase OXA-18 [Holospora undulata HU1]